MLRRALVVLSALAALSCADDEPVGPFLGTGGSAGSVSYPNLECDALVPSQCGYPFPSNVWSVEDSSTPTGRRVNVLPGMLPIADNGGVSLPDPINRGDGFSPSSALLSHFPGATDKGLSGPNQIEATLGPDSLTVVLDTETGRLVPHFAELDLSHGDPEQRSLSIRPVVRLEDARRYVVAVRGLETESGPVEPSPGFRALRDDTAFDGDPSIEARRGLYADIFAHLERAGVARDDLLLAWDFTTRSQEDITGWLLHMRDEALTEVGEQGPTYVIDQAVADPDADIAFQIDGRMQVPLYLEHPGAGAALVFGDDGMPEPNTTQPSYDVEFSLYIPQSAKTTPAKLLLYGHGLLGSRSQIGASHFRKFMNTYGYAFFGVNLVGMSAEGDSNYIQETISAGRMHELSDMFDRMHQGALNHVLAMRMMSRRFATDATYGKYLNPGQRYYHGISQGGIFGGVYMSITPDVERGVLEVMGQPYTLLLNRSVDFAPFFLLLSFVYPDARDQQLLLALVQMMWDRVEPSGYTKYLREGLGGSPKHEVLMRAAIADHQVSTLGAHVMARAVGSQHLDTGVRGVWGLEQVAGPIQGSAYAEYDFGLPPEPLCNVPMTYCDDPHGKLRSLDAAEQQMDLFLRTGEAKNFCPNGVCSYPELSGCEPGKTYPDLCDQ